MKGDPTSPVADTPVRVTLALQLNVTDPTNPFALKFAASILLSVFVVAVPNADVPACPDGV